MKSFRKSKILRVLTLLLALTTTMGVQSAFASVATISMDASTHQVDSDWIWGDSGSYIYFDWFNNNSTHNVGFGVYFSPYPALTSPTLVSAAKVAPSGAGSSYDIFPAPGDGYYFLRAVCGGNGQIGCVGSGTLNTNW